MWRTLRSGFVQSIKRVMCRLLITADLSFQALLDFVGNTKRTCFDGQFGGHGADTENRLRPSLLLTMVESIFIHANRYQFDFKCFLGEAQGSDRGRICNRPLPHLPCHVQKIVQRTDLQ